MIKPIIKITLVSTLILGGCGGKLNSKTAKKVLLEVQQPVVHTEFVNAEIYEDGFGDTMEILEIYTKSKLIKEIVPIEGSKRSRKIVFNEKKINKKWPDFVVINPKTTNRMEHLLVTNYTTRVGEILRIDTKPVDRLCDALVEYKYEAYDYAPWGKDIAAIKNIGKTVYEACFIKYDKSWGAKDWRKKPNRRG